MFLQSHTENGWKIQLEVQIENISNHDQQTDIHTSRICRKKDYIWEKITIPANKKYIDTKRIMWSCGRMDARASKVV